jgi:hypothetical protein
VSRRQSLDALERLDTPAWCTRALLDRMPSLRGRAVIEPCAGANRLAVVLADEGGCRVDAFDIAPRHPAVVPLDATDHDWWAMIPPGWALVTNPAFSMAAALLRAAWHAERTIALFLRLNWLEAVKDREDLPDPHAQIVVPRPKFIQSPEFEALRIASGKKKWGGDNVTCAWVIWNHRDARLTRHPIQRVTWAQKAQLDAPLRPPVRALAEAIPAHVPTSRGGLELAERRPAE